MIAIYHPTLKSTGYRPFAFADAAEAQKWIDAQPITPNWEVRRDWVFDTFEELQETIK